MVALFMGISVIEDLKERKHFSLFLALLALLLTYGLGLILGVLGTGVSPSRWGYGYFSMNLNAVINPISCGKYNWSSIFKQHEQVLGNYDGFNYLGAGVFLGLFLLIIFTIVFRNIQYITCKLKRNSIFTIAMLLCSFLQYQMLFLLMERFCMKYQFLMWLNIFAESLEQAPDSSTLFTIA